MSIKGLTITRAVGPGRRQGGVTCTPVSITYPDGAVILCESIVEAARVTNTEYKTVRDRVTGKRKEIIKRSQPPQPPDQVKLPAYKGARDRCNNPNHRAYKRYGGRGIQFRFNSYEDYVNELGPRPGPEYSVDRTDNDGHYEPGNIQWATRKQQQNNMHNNVKYKLRRTDSNIIEVTHPDGSITYANNTREASIQLGVGFESVKYQLSTRAKKV